jgi:hypothetical protein
MASATAFTTVLAIALGSQGEIAPRSPPPLPDPGIHESYDPELADLIHDARQDIDRRRDQGELTKPEARRLNREASRIDELADFYARVGLSEFERHDLRFHAHVAAERAQLPRPR